MGRSDSLAVHFAECSALSREHLLVKIENGKTWVMDMGSSNGTFIDGKKIIAKTPIEYSGQSLHLGDLKKGTEVWIETLADAPVQEVAKIIPEPITSDSKPSDPKPSTQQLASTKQAIDLSEKIQLMNLELSEAEKKMRVVTETESSLVKRIEQLIHRETTLKIEIIEKEQLAVDASKKSQSIQTELEEWDARKKLAECELKAFDQKILELRSKNEEDQTLLEKRKVELTELRQSLEQEKESTERLLKSELESTKQNYKIELDKQKSRHELDLEQLQAELKLKRTQLEIEIEELRKKKVSADRDLEALENKSLIEQKKLNDLIQACTVQSHDLQKLKQNFLDHEKNVAEIKVQLADTHTVLNQKKSEFIEIEKKSAELLISTELQTKELLQANLERIQQQSAAHEIELANKIKATDLQCMQIREKHEAEKAEIENKIKNLAEQYVAEKNQIAKEHDLVKLKNEEDLKKLFEQAVNERQSRVKAWEDELAARREKDITELRLVKSQEEEVLRTAISKDREQFARSIANATLSKLTILGNAIPAGLLTNLEDQTRLAITEYAEAGGVSTVSLSASKKQFWIKAASAAAAVILLIFSGIYGPSYFQQKITVLKAENAAENEAFMKQIREQRERMLALDLKSRPNFQDNYVDNILYNPGYLAMKQNDQYHKEWTIRLSKFFFEELLLDDKKVVNFMPLESSLIRSLSDINEVLNSENFEVNQAQMQKIEESKLADLFLAVGGKDNWIRLRKLEEAFYFEHLKSNDTSKRRPAQSQ
jgi:pSer/pThr/pTyr-binding forkhead associated (FHA) protein